MKDINIIEEKSFKYVEFGDGPPIIILHGLMGGLSNFNCVFSFFPKYGYKIIMPVLPLYDRPINETNVEEFAEYLNDFLNSKKLTQLFSLETPLEGT